MCRGTKARAAWSPTHSLLTEVWHRFGAIRILAQLEMSSLVLREMSHSSFHNDSCRIRCGNVETGQSGLTAAGEMICHAPRMSNRDVRIEMHDPPVWDSNRSAAGPYRLVKVDLENARGFGDRVRCQFGMEDVGQIG